MQLSQHILLRLSFDTQDLPCTSCLDACKPANYHQSLSALLALSPCCVPPPAGCHHFGEMSPVFHGGSTCVLWGATCVLWGVPLCLVGCPHTSCGLCVICGCRGTTPEKCSRGEERARSTGGGSQPCQAHLESACSYGLRYISCCCCWIAANKSSQL